MRRTCLPALSAFLAVAACNDVREVAYDDPTSLQTETTQNGITLEIVSPVSSYTPSPQVDIELRVTRLGALADPSLVVRVGLEGGLLVTAAHVAPDDGRYRGRVSLEHGRNTLLVEVRDRDGRLLRDARFTLRYDGTLPGIAVLALARPGAAGCVDAEPLAEPIVNTNEVCVLGRVSDRADSPLASIIVEQAQAQVAAAPGDDGRFAALVPLAADQLNTVGIAVRAANGETSRASLDVRHDGKPPVVTLVQPSTLDVRTDASAISLIGTLADDVGVDALRLETGNSGVTWLPPEPGWSVDVRLETGANSMAVVATDLAGNETTLRLDVWRDRIIRLRLGDAEPATATLRLDRTALEALITPEEREQITLVEIPIRNTIRSALIRLSDPEAYGIDTSTWGAAELNLQRLLVTSPDTADLSGSSLELLLTLSQGIGLPPARLLAQLTDIGVSEPILTIDVLTDVFVDQLVGTHPHVARDTAGEPVLDVSLADALSGLSDLGVRFGPAGEHPGFVVGETSATLFEPGFAMRVDATTNLVERQGIDASDLEKDYIYLHRGGQVLRFDFVDPASFSVVGLVNEPTLDLRFAISESPDFFVVGDDRTARPDDDTGAARGNSAVWDEAPWVLEHLVAESVYRASRDRFAASGYRRELHYGAGAVENAATMVWERGWITITTSGGLGDPPPPFHAWDLLTEVAQLRLHDGGLAEGEADVEFVLRQLPVGLTADELVEALRPTLQEQEALLSELLLGESGITQSECDFYLEPATDGGEAWLVFREPGDTADNVVYPRSGFFADLALSERISERVVASGSDDTTHEKLRARTGQQAFFADDSGAVFRLRVVNGDAAGADILVTSAEEVP